MLFKHVVEVTLKSHPTRAFGHSQHAEEEKHCGECRDRQHVSPDTVADMLQRDAQDCIAKVSEKLSRDDHQLVLSDHAPASVRRRNFSKVNGDGYRRAADRQAQQKSARNHDVNARSECATHCRAEEYDCQNQNHFAATHGVSDSPARHRTDCRADQQRAHDETFQLRSQIQLVLRRHERKCTVDDARVVTEEQTAKCRGDHNRSYEGLRFGTDVFSHVKYLPLIQRIIASVAASSEAAGNFSPTASFNALTLI